MSKKRKFNFDQQAPTASGSAQQGRHAPAPARPPTSPQQAAIDRDRRLSPAVERESAFTDAHKTSDSLYRLRAELLSALDRGEGTLNTFLQEFAEPRAVLFNAFVDAQSNDAVELRLQNQERHTDAIAIYPRPPGETFVEGQPVQVSGLVRVNKSPDDWLTFIVIEAAISPTVHIRPDPQPLPDPEPERARPGHPRRATAAEKAAILEAREQAARDPQPPQYELSLSYKRSRPFFLRPPVLAIAAVLVAGLLALDWYTSRPLKSEAKRLPVHAAPPFPEGGTTDEQTAHAVEILELVKSKEQAYAVDGLSVAGELWPTIVIGPGEDPNDNTYTIVLSDRPSMHDSPNPSYFCRNQQRLPRAISAATPDLVPRDLIKRTATVVRALVANFSGTITLRADQVGRPLPLGVYLDSCTIHSVR